MAAGNRGRPVLAFSAGDNGDEEVCASREERQCSVRVQAVPQLLTPITSLQIPSQLIRGICIAEQIIQSRATSFHGVTVPPRVSLQPHSAGK